MSLTLLDWRRRVAALYAAARAARDPEQGWRTWRDGRDELFAGASRLPARRGGAERVPGPALRALRPRAAVRRRSLEPAEPHRLEVPTATDGVVPFDRIGAVELDGAGRLDVWWLGSYGGGVFVPLRDGSAGPDDVRRRALPARHGQGRRPGRRRRPAGGGPQLRLPPVVHLRPALVLPAGARGQPAGRAGRRRGAVAPRRLVLTYWNGPREGPPEPGRSGAQPWARAPSELKTRPMETSPCWMAALVSGPPASNSWKSANSRPYVSSRPGWHAGRSGHSPGPPRVSDPSPHASASSDRVVTPTCVGELLGDGERVLVGRLGRLPEDQPDPLGQRGERLDRGVDVARGDLGAVVALDELGDRRQVLRERPGSHRAPGRAGTARGCPRSARWPGSRRRSGRRRRGWPAPATR